jgi:hypothetical protein
LFGFYPASLRLSFIYSVSILYPSRMRVVCHEMLFSFNMQGSAVLLASTQAGACAERGANKAIAHTAGVVIASADEKNQTRGRMPLPSFLEG